MALDPCTWLYRGPILLNQVVSSCSSLTPQVKSMCLGLSYPRWGFSPFLPSQDVTLRYCLFYALFSIPLPQHKTQSISHKRTAPASRVLLSDCSEHEHKPSNHIPTLTYKLDHWAPEHLMQSHCVGRFVTSAWGKGISQETLFSFHQMPVKCLPLRSQGCPHLCRI